MKLCNVNMLIKTLLVFMLLMNSCFFSAQINVDKSNRIKPDIVLKKADIAYQYFKFSIAADYYETYLRNPSNHHKEVLQKLADCYFQMRKYDRALLIYKFLYPNRIEGSTQKEQFRIGEIYARYGQYQLASKWLKGIEGYSLKANVYDDKQALNAMKKDSLKWKLGFLNINTSYREYSPFIINNTLFFSSNKPLSIKTKAFGWDTDNYARLWEIPLYEVDEIPLSLIRDSSFVKKLSLDNNVKLAGNYECADIQPEKQVKGLLFNTPFLKADSTPIGTIVRGFGKIPFNSGTISMDNYAHLYFSANYPVPDKKGVNRICLMEGLYSPDGVTQVHKLPFGDHDSYSVMHPAVNAQGTLLVFSSDKANGQGQYDLYYSQRTAVTLPWDSLKPFGKNINSLGNEVFPSITPNGYLYYSSDFTPGLGGLDIFRLPLKDALAGKGVPEHLSYPINSSSDDFGWTQPDSTGLKGYFTSDRLNNDDNLFSVLFKPEVIAKLPRKSFFEGTVIEKLSKKPIGGATVFLLNVKEDSVYVSKTDKKGKYHFPIVNTSNVLIKVVDKRYNKKSNCLSAKVIYIPQSKDTIQKALHAMMLDQFKVGYVWKIGNIQYENNKWNLPASALPVIDSLVTLMKEQPLMVELGSHTDSRGSYRNNLILSQHRAETAAAYLVTHGIDPNRITAKGYGSSRLLNRCAPGVQCTEEEHQVNRRTEVKVTGFTGKQKEADNIDPDLFNDGDKIHKNLFPKGFFTDSK